jgi:LPS sulfotransferase NodH
MSVPHDPVTTFVLFFQGRAGSTYLIEALDSHPAIVAEKEELSVEWMKERSASAQLQWARKFLTPPFSEGCRAVGFKTKLKDVLDPEGLGQLLKDLNTRVILLRRRNLVKLAISFLNAERLHDATGDWNLYAAKDRPPPVSLDPSVFRNYLTGVEEADRELVDYVRRLGLQTLCIYYEGLFGAQQATLVEVLSFLGVPIRPVEGRCLKNTSDDLRQAVLNLDELQSEYVGTPYEAMFDEVPG